jgi:prepilin-type N-terminal cleavage/methylation domain-containing protein
VVAVRKFIHSDEGFSLSELVVVVGLMGIILAAAWLSYSVAFNGTRSADRESMSAKELAAPLLQCERLLIQQHNILIGTIDGRVINPTPYLIAFNTDIDHDSHIETTIIEATTAGELVITTSEVTEHGPEAVVWSTENHNQETGTPLFTYYDGNGAVITNMSAVKSDARRITVTIATEYEGQAFSDSRTITFRNR